MGVAARTEHRAELATAQPPASSARAAQPARGVAAGSKQQAAGSRQQAEGTRDPTTRLSPPGSSTAGYTGYYNKSASLSLLTVVAVGILLLSGFTHLSGPDNQSGQGQASSLRCSSLLCSLLAACLLLLQQLLVWYHTTPRRPASDSPPPPQSAHRGGTAHPAALR